MSDKPRPRSTHSRSTHSRSTHVSVTGPVVGSAVGDGNVVANNTINWTDATDSRLLLELREAVALLRAEVEKDAANAHAVYELRTIEAEIAKPEPDPGAIRTRWDQVKALLGPLQHAANIATITALFLRVFGVS